MSTKKPKLKFVRKDQDTWESTDGRYRVWVQGRPLPPDPALEWGAARLDPKTNDYYRNYGRAIWLTETAGSRREAIEACQEDADKREDA